jgi:hypothetical protein
MAKGNKLNGKTVQTSEGLAKLQYIKFAKKEYTCPLCLEMIKIAEGHFVILPSIHYGLRRHCHRDCIEYWMENNKEFILRNAL